MKKVVVFFILSLVGVITVCAQRPAIFNEDIKKGRKIDVRSKMYISPVRIIHQSDTTGKWIDNGKGLLKVGNGQAELINRDLTRMRTTDQHRAYIILDFGMEIHGGLELVPGYMKSKNPVGVRIRFGESVSETLADIDTLSGAMNDHANFNNVVILSQNAIIVLK